jgi:hypothetical protein
VFALRAPRRVQRRNAFVWRDAPRCPCRPLLRGHFHRIKKGLKMPPPGRRLDAPAFIC